MGLVRDGREWVYGPLCRLPGVLRVCVCDVCVWVLLLLICQGLRDRRLLPVGRVLRCDELRTPAVTHIPPLPDLPIPCLFLSLFSMLPVAPACVQVGRLVKGGSEERRIGGGVSLVVMPSEPSWHSSDKRILFKTADAQFLDAQNKRGALAISPA